MIGYPWFLQSCSANLTLSFITFRHISITLNLLAHLACSDSHGVKYQRFVISTKAFWQVAHWWDSLKSWYFAQGRCLGWLVTCNVKQRWFFFNFIFGDHCCFWTPTESEPWVINRINVVSFPKPNQVLSMPKSDLVVLCPRSNQVVLLPKSTQILTNNWKYSFKYPKHKKPTKSKSKKP